jgi:hypothetical protein
LALYQNEFQVVERDRIECTDINPELCGRATPRWSVGRLGASTVLNAELPLKIVSSARAVRGNNETVARTF